MAKQKPIVVDERTHEILRREALARMTEDAAKGTGRNISMGRLLKNIADEINEARDFPNLPEQSN